MNVEQFLKSRARATYSREFVAVDLEKSTIDEINDWCSSRSFSEFNIETRSKFTRWQFNNDNDASLFALRWSNYFKQL